MFNYRPRQPILRHLNLSGRVRRGIGLGALALSLGVTTLVHAQGLDSFAVFLDDKTYTSDGKGMASAPPFPISWTLTSSDGSPGLLENASPPAYDDSTTPDDLDWENWDDPGFYDPEYMWEGWDYANSDGSEFSVDTAQGTYVNADGYGDVPSPSEGSPVEASISENPKPDGTIGPDNGATDPFAGMDAVQQGFDGLGAVKDAQEAEVKNQEPILEQMQMDANSEAFGY